MSEELKRKANPNVELLGVMKEVHKEIIINNNLTCRALDVAEEHLLVKKEFTGNWAKSKFRDTKISLIILAIGALALYLDVIKLNDTDAIMGMLRTALSIFV